MIYLLDRFTFVMRKSLRTWAAPMAVALVLMFCKSTPVFAQLAGVNGQIHYVSLQGNNTDGTTLPTAWNEVNQIKWGTVHPGDFIAINTGTYRTPLQVRVS